MIELVLVIGIVAIIAAFTLPNLFNRKAATELSNTVNQISITLREAQSRAISQIGGLEWGVRFDNGNPPYFAMFSTPTYSPSTRVIYTTLPKGIGYVTSTLDTDSSSTVIFSQITGKPSKAIDALSFYPVKEGQPVMTISVALSGQIALIDPSQPVTAATVAAVAVQIQAVTATAQQNAVDHYQGHNNWGIYFDNTNPTQPRYALYHTSYNPSNVAAYYNIPVGVEYTPPELPPNTSVSVLFNPSGNPDTAYTVGVQINATPATAAYVYIQSGGGLCYKFPDDFLECSGAAID